MQLDVLRVFPNGDTGVSGEGTDLIGDEAVVLGEPFLHHLLRGLLLVREVLLRHREPAGTNRAQSGRRTAPASLSPRTKNRATNENSTRAWYATRCTAESLLF